MLEFCASILAADFARLGQDVGAAEAAGVDVFHIDVMDGHFVPNISLGVPVLASLHKALPDAYYDVHLMISQPVRYAEAFVQAGASCITFHVEAVEDAAEAIKAIHALGVGAGVSIKPATPVEDILPILDQVEMVLVMSVEPGFGGQKFMPAAVDKIAALDAYRREHGLGFRISVDGGVNSQTGALCTAAGADILVAGSQVFAAADPAAAVAELRAL